MESLRLISSGESPQQICNGHLVARGARKGASSFHGYASWFWYGVGFISICSVVINLVTLSLCIGLQNQVDKQNERIDHLSQFIKYNQQLSDITSQKVAAADPRAPLVKRSEHSRRRGQSRGRRRGTRRSRQHSCTCTRERILKYVRENPSELPIHPATHITGVNQNNSYYLDANLNNSTILHWYVPTDLLFASAFGYPRRDGHENITAQLGVITSGLYFIYAQITLNGRHQDARNNPLPDCGHDVIRVRDGQLSTLFKTVTTQDQQGRSYNNELYPIDTQSTQGLAALRQGDKLAVRIWGCPHSMDRINMDGSLATFGAYLINFF